MPNYTYKCPRCGKFDAYGHFDEDTKLCPRCESALAVRQAVYKNQMVNPQVGQPG